MSRQPRIEFPGAIYHVLNRGNYRTDLFDSAGAAQAFVDCLFQTCERMGWRLHAYCVMRNHYHLALETPNGNLVDGIHWLQSTFGNRFNRFRGENGRAFQGRYKAILVEPGLHLSRLVNYIHLNPVRAKIVTLDLLPQFRWSSYRHFMRSPSERPPALVCVDWLNAMGAPGDSPAGWRFYREHLAWLMADEDRQKEEAFDHMSQGWLHGGADFQKAVLGQFKQMTVARDWSHGEVRQINQTEHGPLLDRALKALGHAPEFVGLSPKSAPWKIAIAVWMKSRGHVTNRWLSENLKMGPPDAVSRYVGEYRKGQRNDSQRLVEKLTTKVRG